MKFKRRCEQKCRFKSQFILGNQYLFCRAMQREIESGISIKNISKVKHLNGTNVKHSKSPFLPPPKNDSRFDSYYSFNDIEQQNDLILSDMYQWVSYITGCHLL